MPIALQAALIEKGWNPQKINHWGWVTGGNVHYIEMHEYSRDKKKLITCQHVGPLRSINVGKWAAIVRFD